MLFGKKKPEEETLLLLDVENGSVGAALVRIARGGQDEESYAAPKLFGETREFLPHSPTRNSMSLLAGAGKALSAVLSRTAAVAARLRSHPATRDTGTVSRAVAFFAAPWGSPDLAGAPVFADVMRRSVQERIRAALGDLPIGLHTGAGAAFGGSRHLLPYEDSYLLCIVTGEISELVLVSGGVVAGYATVPQGRHSVLRTVRAHSGASHHEAHSLLQLDPYQAGSPLEPLQEASRQYAEELAEVVAGLVGRAPVERVYVIAHGGVGEWFARALSASPELGALFPRGGTVRALHARHVMPHLAAHGPESDLLLGLHALYAASLHTPAKIYLDHARY